MGHHVGVATLTTAQARRIAVAAQGLHERKPRGPVTRAHLRRLLSRIQLLQLDSVSVAVRAHYAPVFSRLGPYDRDLLDRAAWSHSARAPRLLVEYWAHEAALMAIEDWPLLRWRMREYSHGRWGTEIVRENPRLADDILAAVAELGPSTAGQIEAHLELAPRGAAAKKEMWDRTDTKWVAEALWSSGALTTAHRAGFARHYDLTERVLPAEIVHRQVDDAEAVRELVGKAAAALGVGTQADIRDYFRLSAAQVKPALAELVAAGELEPVSIDGTSAYLCAGQTIPSTDRGTALLCPFDPLVFFRPRLQRLFGFHYRIEIYTPAHKRKYGYYVWPFLLDGQLVARVDLKRTDIALHVVGAFAEDGQDLARVAAALAGQLHLMAGWLGLGGVSVGHRGDLAGELRRVC